MEVYLIEVLKMATMNISLPDDMKAWVENQAAAAHFSTTSDYVRDLVRKEQERRAGIAKLQALLDESIASGVSTRTLDEIFAEAREIAKQRGLLDA
jgi:antitoxin ParD1/3/4